jgi:hypothetical protein
MGTSIKAEGMAVKVVPFQNVGAMKSTPAAEVAIFFAALLHD